MRKIILYIGVIFSLSACYNDGSEIAYKEIIEIEVLNNVKDTINIYFNDLLQISTEIDAGASQEVTYQWDVGEYKQSVKEDVNGNKYTANTTVFKTVSKEKNLEYIPRDLGHYMVRHIVTNEHGSTITYHHLFVNSPFEEGFVILSRDPSGVGNMSFLKTLTPEEIEAGLKPEFRVNVYKDINGESQYSDPLEVFKINNALFILYGEDQRMVHLNAKTMEKVVEFDFKYYNSNFIPTSQASYDGKYCREITVASEDGQVVNVQLEEFGIFPYTEKLPEGYKFTHIYSRPSYFSSKTCVFLSSDRNVVCYTGFSPGETFATMLACDDYFKNTEVVNVFGDDDNNLSVLNKRNGQLKISQIGNSVYSHSTGKLDLQFEYNVPYPEMIDAKTSFLRNDLYSCVFFNYKNAIYKWYYSQDNTMPSIGQKFCAIPEGEIVCDVSHYVVPRTIDDYQTESKRRQSEIYVATYNPNREGELKGSMYVFSSETGEETMRYEGISYEPVKIIYKVK